jgi:hypothetical protein
LTLNTVSTKGRSLSVFPSKEAIAFLNINQQDDGNRTFITPIYIYLSALLKAKMIAFLKFNQQDDSYRIGAVVNLYGKQHHQLVELTQHIL